MAFSYVNRKRDTWYLFEGKNRLGKTRYFLTLSKSAKNSVPLDVIPDGYEVFEGPFGRPYCRKRLPVLITDDEVETLKKELVEQHLEDCIVERRARDLIVHEPGKLLSAAELEEWLGPGGSEGFEYFKERRRYQAVRRFELMDDILRSFSVSRWRLPGKRSGWFPLNCIGSLADLAKKYVKHIGKESFYELM